MNTVENFLKYTGLPKKYKGSAYITKILYECEFEILLETPTTKIIKALSKLYETPEQNIKRDILYAKQKHLEKMPEAIKTKIFGSQNNQSKLSTKEYFTALKIAIECDVNNIIPTKNW